MKVLVIGKGGREHALVRALALSPAVSEVLAVPGAQGFAKDALCFDLPLTDRPALAELIRQKGVDLVVIGGEGPLTEGLADFLREKNVEVFGPGQAAAQLEGSKIFAKQFMLEAQVPTARFAVVDSVKTCLAAAEQFSPPYVLKADGLAAGKGVVICQNLDELREQSLLFFEKKIFGNASHRALLEEYQEGWELSVLMLTNGSDYRLLPLTQDNKRLNDGDQGPNTGGMGVVGPIQMGELLMEQIHRTILKPTVAHLEARQLDYRGVLYVGLMITHEGPKILEYNVRFGDPEAQVLMPLLDGDWGTVMSSVAQGRLPEIRWRPIYSACVVLAAEGYPVNPVKGVSIDGNVEAETPSSYFLHAGTRLNDGQWQTDAGRVLNAVAVGSTLKEAVDNAYRQAAKATWKGQCLRRDIGHQFL